MPTRNDLYPSRWLKADDLPKPIVAMIDRVPVVHFVDETLKPWILNATNYDAIETLCGRENTDDWAGVRLELYAIAVSGPNGPTRGIRIRAPKRAAPTRARAVAAVTVPDDGFGADVPTTDADPEDDAVPF